MTLAEFKALWEADGTRLVEHKSEQAGGARWLLYSVEFPQSTNDYGRHMAMILKVDTVTHEILMHDLKNQQGSVNWTQEIDSWYRDHVGRY